MATNVHVLKCPGPPTIPPTLEGQHWVDTLNDQTYLAVGTATLADWILVNASDTIITATATASSSSDIDTIPLSSFCTVKYIVCIFNTTEDKWKSFEMLASKVTSTSVQDALYGIIGSVLDVDFDFIVSGADAKLVATNNETFDVDIRVHKNVF